MLNALYIAATGLQAEQDNVSTISSNLVNMNTNGFKKTRVMFRDLVGSDASVSAQPPVDPAQQATSGLGIAIASKATMFDQGVLNSTGSQYDLAVQGDGFVEVSMPDGTPAYVRGGTLKVNNDGLLATQDGYPLKANISVPTDVSTLTINADGRVYVTTSTDSSQVEAGRIDLVRFSSEEDLTSVGNGLYQPNEKSGEAISTQPGTDGAGVLAQGNLEGSNVNEVDEMVNLMVAQRAYEASSKLVQASDEMLGIVNGLRK